MSEPKRPPAQRCATTRCRSVAALSVLAVTSALTVACTDSFATTTPPPSTMSGSGAVVVNTSLPVADENALAEIDDIVRFHLAAHDLDGAGLVLVDANSGIVAQQYWGEFDAERVSLVASSSKMITATVLLGLAGDGVLDIDTPIAEVVEWAPDFDDMTIADLLSNTSGLVGLAPNALYPPYLCQLEADEELGWCGVRIANTTADDDAVVPPGSEFRYGGAQWQLAGAIAVDVSGQTWDELLDRYLREPCGLDSLGYTNQWIEFGGGFSYPVDFVDGDAADLPDTANPNMEAGAYIDPPDFGALLTMQLNNGRCGDAQPVPAALLKQARQDRLADLGLLADADRGYGLGWFVDRGDGSVSAPGAYGAYAWIDPARRIGAYLVLEASGEEAGDLFERLKPKIIAALE